MVGLFLLTLAGFVGLGFLLRCIIMKQAEVATRLEALDLKVEKIGTETSSILAEIATAKEDASPEVVAALEKVEARLQTVDDLVKDKEPETPPSEPEAPLPTA